MIHVLCSASTLSSVCVNPKLFSSVLPNLTLSGVFFLIGGLWGSHSFDEVILVSVKGDGFFPRSSSPCWVFGDQGLYSFPSLLTS